MIIAEHPKSVLAYADANAGTRVGSFFRPKAEAIQEILLVKVGMVDQAIG
jgi:hypothetical protein